MKKVHKLIISSFIGPFVATFVICLFILVMQFLWLYIDDLMGKGLNLLVVAELLIYASSTLVNLALPMALLLSSIMTFGALAESSELTALKATGMSLFRIMWPMTVVVCFITIGAFMFANFVTPIAYLKWRSLLYDITEKKPALSIQPKVFFDGFEGYSIRVSDKNPETNELTDVLIYDHSDAYGGNRRVIRAKRGKMAKWDDGKSLVLTLEDGYSYEEVAKSSLTKGNLPNITNRFEKQQLVIDLSYLEFKRSDESVFRSGYKMLNIFQLYEVQDSINNINIEQTKDIADYVERTFKTSNDSLTALPISEDTAIVNSALVMNRTIADRAKNVLQNAKLFIEKNNDQYLNKQEQNRRYGVEIHRKFTFSIACLVLFFLGAPLGAIIRKGGLGLPVVFAIMFFLLFHVLSITGEKMAIAEAAPLALGMWLNIIVITPVAIFLTYKATMDSPLFESTFYKRLLSFVVPKKQKDN